VATTQQPPHPKICASCGKSNDPKATSCGDCGKFLPAPQK
jgi:ribosomal protein L40E